MSTEGKRTRVRKHRGLRSIRSEPGALKLLFGLERVIYSTEPELRGLRAHSRRDPDGSEVRVRAEKTGRRTRHTILIPPDVAKAGLTLERSMELPRRPNTRAQHFEASGIPDNGNPLYSGLANSCDWPIRKLTMRVRFPAQAFPSEAGYHVWPRGMVPDPEMTSAAGGIHPGLELRRNESRSELSLRIDWPLMGLTYSIGWALR